MRTEFVVNLSLWPVSNGFNSSRDSRVQTVFCAADILIHHVYVPYQRSSFCSWFLSFWEKCMLHDIISYHTLQKVHV